MRYVLIDLSSDNYLQQPQLFGGYAGEHNETVLQVILPKRMISVEYSDYCFDFQTSEDNRISIPASKLDNGILSCYLTEQITIAGKLLFNVVAHLSNKDTIELTSKTNMVALYIGDSPDGKSILPDPNGYKDEILKIIDDRVDELLEGIQAGEGGMIIIDQSYNPESENAQSGKAVAKGLRTKADRNKIFDYITYEINNNQVTITGCDTSISGSHIIPDIIDGYPVTSIGMNAFENCTGITSVIIPKGITSLYPDAFYGCSNLTSIEIPDTVNDMGYDVFSGCTKLKEVSFNAKITSLYGSTFADCTSLTSIVIPNGVIDIAKDFYNCSSLKTITIPDSVTSIEDYAFYNCTSLTDIYYSGTQEQWDSITIYGGNDSLLNATIHYNQELATKEFVLNNGGSGGTVDQTYNPESENAQSGKAVAEAIDNLATKNVNEGTLDFRKPDVRCVQLPFAEIQSIETYGIDILKEPEEDTDAVNKGYVDTAISNGIAESIGNINSVLATIVDGVE